MLSASLSGKDRKTILKGLKNKTVDIVVGTHSLFGKDVVFEKLGLVVTDEEHRFGVKQKGFRLSEGAFDRPPENERDADSADARHSCSENPTFRSSGASGQRKEPITKYLNYKDMDLVHEHIQNQIKSRPPGLRHHADD